MTPAEFVLMISTDDNVSRLMDQRICCNGQGCGCMGATVLEYLENRAKSPDALDTTDGRVTFKPKPWDLSNLLKHAFIQGRMSAGASNNFHGHAWAKYDPTESAAYARILSVIIGNAAPTPSDKIADAARVLLDDLAAALDTDGGEDGRASGRRWSVASDAAEAAPTAMNRPTPIQMIRAALLALGTP